MLSFAILCVLLGVGHLLRMYVRPLHRLYLPSSVIAGLMGLIVLQVFQYGGHPLPVSWTAGWSKLPGYLINIVFACLFMGAALPKVSTLWRRAGLQLAYGQIVAWGQYMVAGAFVLLLLSPIFKIPELFAGVLPVGFEGGHGTAGGMGPVFVDLGWAAGKDYALASATAGVLGAIIVGMALINWAARKGITSRNLNLDTVEVSGQAFCVLPKDNRPSAGKLTVSSEAIETFTLQLAAVGVAILIGILIKEGLLIIENHVDFLSRHHLLRSFPLFPLCMIGGLIVQSFEDRFDRYDLLNHGLLKRIQNTSLDFLVVAAIATIRLEVIVSGLVPLLILVAAGILWNVFCLMWLAPRVFKTAWFERAIAELGQSMGVTASGLLLLRVVDPDYETEAADAFACKQLLHEPFMGGGLWTGLAIPLIAAVGLLPVFLISTGAIVIWLVVLGAVFLSRRKPH